MSWDRCCASVTMDSSVNATIAMRLFIAIHIQICTLRIEVEDNLNFFCCILKIPIEILHVYLQIFVRSTDYDRTLMSAEANLAGLYPPNGSQVFEPNVQWQPIPVHTVPQSQERVSVMSEGPSSISNNFALGFSKR